jgi:hypothetical protein
MNSLLAAATAAAIAWQGITEIATGGGERGPWQQNESRYDFVDDPAVALGGRGEAAVVWVDQKRKDVFFRRLADGRALNVSRSPATFSWLPRVAFAPGDSRKIFVLWQEIIFTGGSHGGDILFARSLDGGATFSAPRNLSNFSQAGDGKGRITKDRWDNGSLDLAVAAGGEAYVAWTEYEGRLWVGRLTPEGSFSAIALAAGKPARAPSLAVARDGTVYLAWTVGEDPAADIRVARSSDGGATFGEPVIAAKSPPYSDAPKLAVDAQGMVHLAWHEGRRVLYARSRDGARSFGAPRTLADAGGFPMLALDGSGNVYVTWELFGGPRPRGLGYSVSRDAGSRFSEAAVIPDSLDRGPNGSSQGLLMQKLAVDADGAVAIVNSSLEEGRRSRVWLIRGALSAPRARSFPPAAARR